MTYQNNCTLPNELMKQIAEQGLDYLPELIRVVVNAAMKAERQQYLGVSPYECSEQQRDQANGFKPKTVRTRMGEIEFAVPQVRTGEYYPQALEKGLRSERALTMAMAEMYVQGTSTRKVNAIVEKLCGSQVSSSLVSKATAELDIPIIRPEQRLLLLVTPPPTPTLTPSPIIVATSSPSPSMTPPVTGTPPETAAAPPHQPGLGLILGVMVLGIGGLLWWKFWRKS